MASQTHGNFGEVREPVSSVSAGGLALSVAVRWHKGRHKESHNAFLTAALCLLVTFKYGVVYLPNSSGLGQSCERSLGLAWESDVGSNSVV